MQRKLTYTSLGTVNIVLNHKLVGKGEPLLFMHGLGADLSQTTSALGDLENTQLIAPDFRAHGGSFFQSQEQLNFNQFADDAVALLDALKLEKVSIGGLSMGSGVAINMALRYPERVQKCILLRPSWLGQQMPPHLKLVADIGSLICQYGLKRAAQELESMSAYRQLQTENQWVADSLKALFTRSQALTGAEVLKAMWQDQPFSSLADLKRMRNRVLVLCSPKDELHPIAVAEQIQAALSHSEPLVFLPARYHEAANYRAQLRSSVKHFLNTPATL